MRCLSVHTSVHQSVGNAVNQERREKPEIIWSSNRERYGYRRANSTDPGAEPGAKTGNDRSGYHHAQKKSYCHGPKGCTELSISKAEAGLQARNMDKPSRTQTSIREERETDC